MFEEMSTNSGSANQSYFNFNIIHPYELLWNTIVRSLHEFDRDVRVLELAYFKIIFCCPLQPHSLFRLSTCTEYH